MTKTELSSLPLVILVAMAAVLMKVDWLLVNLRAESNYGKYRSQLDGDAHLVHSCIVMPPFP